jgi:hypothetical protein
MEDNFALRYVLKHPGVNSLVELVPSRALRRWLGDYSYLMHIISSLPGVVHGRFLVKYYT